MKKFNQKKEDEKLDQQEIGSQSPAVAEATSTKLIIELDNMKYTFNSEYAEEDLIYTIEEIFLEKNAKLESMWQCRPRSAESVYPVVVKLASGQESAWRRPALNTLQAQVIQDLKRAPS